MEIEFPYSNEESRTFGIVKRPRMVMRIFSKTRDIWIPIKKTLVDTGADITLVPRSIGELLVEDVTTGKYGEMSGIVPGSVLVVYIHKLKIRVGDREFEAPVAMWLSFAQTHARASLGRVGDSNDVPSVFGRVKGLDLFDANFSYGKTTKL